MYQLKFFVAKVRNHLWRDSEDTRLWVIIRKKVKVPCLINGFFFFLIFIYLFIWPRRVLFSTCRTFVAVCRIFVGHAESLVAVCGIFSCDMWTLSCGLWDLVPRPGIKPGPPELGVRRPSHWTTRKVPSRFLKLSSRKILEGQWEVTKPKERLRKTQEPKQIFEV